MAKKLYESPVIMDLEPGQSGVIGQGTGQGSVAPENMTFEDWFEEIAWGGANPDVDYDQDGDVDEDDYKYWKDNQLWNG